MLLALLTACVRPTPIDGDAWPATGCEAPAALGDSGAYRRESLVLARPNDADLAAELLVPKAGDCHPALLLIPPGFEAGLDELEEDAYADLAGRGVVVAAFDPRGRGESTGEEDAGGALQQDDLAAVLSWLAARPEVDPARVVVRSRSYGVVVVAGALDRHPSLAPRAVQDIEGPALLPDDLAHVPDFTRERLEALATDEDWWAERSASLHIGAYAGHYLRVQGRLDHATGPWRGHALEMLLAAQAGAPAPVELNGVSSEVWDEATVTENALPGEIEHDDPAVLALLEGLLEG